jgi:hypothetical protein
MNKNLFLDLFFEFSTQAEKGALSEFVLQFGINSLHPGPLVDVMSQAVRMYIPRVSVSLS